MLSKKNGNKYKIHTCDHWIKIKWRPNMKLICMSAGVWVGPRKLSPIHVRGKFIWIVLTMSLNCHIILKCWLMRVSGKLSQVFHTYLFVSFNFRHHWKKWENSSFLLFYAWLNYIFHGLRAHEKNHSRGRRNFF